MSRANGWAGLLHARAAGCVIGHSARQSEIGVMMMMQWRGEAQRALLGYHESKKTDFSAYIFLTFLGQSHPGGGTPCPILPRVAHGQRFRVPRREPSRLIAWLKCSSRTA